MKALALHQKKEMIEKYSRVVEHQMQQLYSQLKEREQRHYAAVEALKLGHGGKQYIQQLFSVHHKTLKRAIDELLHPERFAPLPTQKQRRSGGGRKKKQFSLPTSKSNSMP